MHVALGIDGYVVSALPGLDAEQLFASLGAVAATWRTETEERSTRVIVRRGVRMEPSGFEAQVPDRAVVLEGACEQSSPYTGLGSGSSAPRRGETLQVGETRYTVDRVLEDDGDHIQLLVVEE